MAARLGFEPRQTDPESAVLPLHNGAKLLFKNNMLIPLSASGKLDIVTTYFE